MGVFFMNNLSKIVAVSMVLAFLSFSQVMAKNPNNQGNNNGQGNSQNNGKNQNSYSKNNGKPNEMYYAGISKQDAKRYAKQYKFYGYKPLPPGIRKNMARGKPIPPGLAYNRLPANYLATLPHYNGYEWRGYGSDLVLVATSTAIIADILIDALN
jgi:Ni/Co efflux regulator RcnB